MKVFLVLGVIWTVCASGPQFFEFEEEWQEFKKSNNKTYHSEEEEMMKKNIYFKNKAYVEAHNRLYEAGVKSFELKLNRFADMSSEEIARQYKGYKMSAKLGSSAEIFESTNTKLPDHVDWRSKNVVTPVKDQLECGSCWAFSSTGSMEGQHALKTGKLVSLSEQNLVDCSNPEGNEGCTGGLIVTSFNYTIMNGGIDTEGSYPYEGQDGECRFRKENVGATFSSWIEVKKEDEKALQEAVAKVGPISVAIDANHDSFHFYNKGVYYEEKCRSDYPDHAVLVVGYGVDNGKEYWLVKNSWGPWGENGYIKMSRNKNNNCGIASNASYPIV